MLNPSASGTKSTGSGSRWYASIHPMVGFGKGSRLRVIEGEAALISASSGWSAAAD